MCMPLPPLSCEGTIALPLEPPYTVLCYYTARTPNTEISCFGCQARVTVAHRPYAANCCYRLSCPKDDQSCSGVFMRSCGITNSPGATPSDAPTALPEDAPDTGCCSSTPAPEGTWLSLPTPLVSLTVVTRNCDSVDCRPSPTYEKRRCPPCPAITGCWLMGAPMP